MYDDEVSLAFDDWVCDIDKCGKTAINGFEVEIEVAGITDEDHVGVLLVRYCPEHTDRAEELRRALTAGAQ